MNPTSIPTTLGGAQNNLAMHRRRTKADCSRTKYTPLHLQIYKGLGILIKLVANSVKSFFYFIGRTIRYHLFAKPMQTKRNSPLSDFAPYTRDSFHMSSLFCRQGFVNIQLNPPRPQHLNFVEYKEENDRASVKGNFDWVKPFGTTEISTFTPEGDYEQFLGYAQEFKPGECRVKITEHNSVIELPLSNSVWGASDKYVVRIAIPIEKAPKQPITDESNFTDDLNSAEGFKKNTKTYSLTLPLIDHEQEHKSSLPSVPWIDGTRSHCKMQITKNGINFEAIQECFSPIVENGVGTFLEQVEQETTQKHKQPIEIGVFCINANSCTEIIRGSFDGNTWAEIR